ncbi:glycine/betaine ABC transporter [Leptolyngbyaceae cyanobacterium CCMR0082]|uniref:Glycine/betaine ABC transporter n=2 Tax=Adonisia turfae TaxID=2950184 RepID=A0A6M0SGN4_9CYAN|nr:glycine betaine ABC transporter substrate-binding protein [Adonisia turfae]NEZ59281.1 glycine/betaine ABC transporter [Adonisia turfae CCMR0081]NEZ66772.1 glycine/betaine ABC transporter [Adonisia turfae CCMR0082]
MFRRRIFLGILLGLSIGGVTACNSSNPDAPKIRIGSKEFTEQYILGNLYEILLDESGFNADYRSIGGTSENHQAIVSGDLDIYPEYTGTALLVHLSMGFDSSMGADEVYNTVKDTYAEQFNLAVLDPTSFNNTYVFLMPKPRASELGIQTVSDLSSKANDLTLGTIQEFTAREDGLPGLKNTYGGFNFRDVVALDPGLLYSGIEEGEIDVTAGFGTDGQIVAYDLLALEDDKNFWPPYPAAPIVRQEILNEYPEIADILNQLSALLDADTMRTLNWQVAGNGRESDEVAREFLEQNGLIGE